MKGLRMLKAVWFVVVAAVAAFMPLGVWAEEFKLPSAEELATLPPEGIEFYAAGIKALDHIDYERAYENLAKAAALQPRAVRLNLIVAALALKHGRAKKSDEARDYYQTAIRCYGNILEVPGLEPNFRRDVENRLKIAKDEMDTLAQRDAQREGRGNMFIKELNRELAKPIKTSKPATHGAPQVPSGQALAGVIGGPGSATPTPALAPYPQAAVGSSVAPATMPALPSAPSAAPQALGAPAAAPGAMPALPGAQPGLPPAPGAGQPGIPAMPGAPGATPAGGPPQGPGGEIMI
ncbi:MAG: hypothetical protein ACP5UB_09810 [Candidatus Sumerlaeaceae bacterium]